MSLSEIKLDTNRSYFIKKKNIFLGLKETVNIKDYDAEEMFDKSLEITGTNYVTFYASILLIVIIAILLMVLTAFLLTNSTFFKLRFKRNGAFYTKIESQQNRIYSL